MSNPTTTPDSGSQREYSQEQAFYLQTWMDEQQQTRNDLLRRKNELDDDLGGLRIWDAWSWKQAEVDAITDDITRIEYNLANAETLLFGTIDERRSLFQEREHWIQRQRNLRGISGRISTKFRQALGILEQPVGWASSTLVEAAPGAAKLATGIQRTFEVGDKGVRLAGNLLQVASAEAMNAVNLVGYTGQVLGAAGGNVLKGTRWGIASLGAGLANTVHGIFTAPGTIVGNAWRGLTGQEAIQHKPMYEMPVDPEYATIPDRPELRHIQFSSLRDEGPTQQPQQNVEGLQEAIAAALRPLQEQIAQMSASGRARPAQGTA